MSDLYRCKHCMTPVDAGDGVLCGCDGQRIDDLKAELFALRSGVRQKSVRATKQQLREARALLSDIEEHAPYWQNPADKVLITRTMDSAEWLRRAKAVCGQESTQ